MSDDDEKTVRRVTADEAAGIARAIRAGQYQLADTVPSTKNGVTVSAIRNGLVISWRRDGVGFGELTLTARNGRLCVDREGMGLAFCLDVIQQALHESVE